MFFGVLCRFPANHSSGGWRLAAAGLVLTLAVCGSLTAWGESVSNKPKHVIGATAILTEASTGLRFPARIDTGAASCSLHVEKIEIEDESPNRLKNIGKRVRFLVVGEEGETEWIESTIAGSVRVRSSVFKNGEFDRRYKVPLTLQWKDVRKEVLITLNDRTQMVYPLLIGRNFLRGDFLVDVAQEE